MTENQKIRYDLYNETKSVAKAKEAYNFIMGESEKPEVQPAAQKQSVEDGLYIVFRDKTFVPADKYDGGRNDVVLGVGVVGNGHAVTVALADVCDDEVPLLECHGESGHYIDNPLDAMNDWNGKENTERLKAVGLHEDIELEECEWIPSAAELALIYKHFDSVNALLELCGGRRIRRDWYWSSTEGSATNAWNLYLGNGSLGAHFKVSYSVYVRPVSAFPENL